MTTESTADLKVRFAQLQKSIQQDPNNIPPYLEIADIFVQVGNHNQALQILSHVLHLAPGNMAACQKMVPLLGKITPSAYHPELDRDLLECLQQELIDHQQLAHLAAAHLLYKYSATGFSTDSPITTDTIFLRLLSRCINVHPQTETLLVKLRATLLHTYQDKDSLVENEITLVCAMALQAFGNEYIWPVSSAEEMLVNQYMPANKSAIACLLLAMYRPLYQFVNNQEIPQLFNAIKNPLVGELIKTTLAEISTEQDLITQIPSLAASNPHAVSIQVRAQYEQNPYPRWRTPPAPAPLPLKDYIQKLPGVSKKIFGDTSLQLLVAGCGTGFEPIDLARMDKNLQITALDLSKASLAYGQRMARELGINNIHFIQGDILDAAQLHQQFDVINSTGVLHHLEDPEAGWRSLCAITRPGGIMRISLYSELARQRIVTARQLISQHNLSGELDDIRKCRALIFNLDPGHPLRDLLQSQDFYSTSGCRDLLFHVQEHRFTLLQIQSLIARLGLRLIGFDVPAQARTQFIQAHPNSLLDLEKWHHFETQHPDTFAGMYQLWLQKP